ncbi:MAG TPA: hypothetical protein VL588_07095 [Bdellovibrionota bacterium]|nr:hypothetical protein [Bdellovibrionota bacterium]
MGTALLLLLSVPTAVLADPPVAAPPAPTHTLPITGPSTRADVYATVSTTQLYRMIVGSQPATADLNHQFEITIPHASTRECGEGTPGNPDLVRAYYAGSQQRFTVGRWRVAYNSHVSDEHRALNACTEFDLSQTEFNQASVDTRRTWASLRACCEKGFEKSSRLLARIFNENREHITDLDCLRDFDNGADVASASCSTSATQTCEQDALNKMKATNPGCWDLGFMSRWNEGSRFSHVTAGQPNPPTHDGDAAPDRGGAGVVVLPGDAGGNGGVTGGH